MKFYAYRSSFELRSGEGRAVQRLCGQPNAPPIPSHFLILLSHLTEMEMSLMAPVDAFPRGALRTWRVELVEHVGPPPYGDGAFHADV